MVVIASTTAVISASCAAEHERAHQIAETGEAGLARDRQQPAFDQILLVGRQHEAGALLEAAAQIIVIERRHARPPENSRMIFGAISSSGSTAEHKPACATERGMPQTTLVASSCAMTLPPAATISAAPRGAVGAHAGENERQSAAPHTCRRRREQRIDRRLAEIDRRIVAKRDLDAVAVAHDPHMAAARRDIDAAGEDRLAMLGFVRAAAADARQMLGQHRGESRRHVLRDQDRRAVDRGAAAFRSAR